MKNMMLALPLAGLVAITALLVLALTACGGGVITGSGGGVDTPTSTHAPTTSSSTHSVVLCSPGTAGCPCFSDNTCNPLLHCVLNAVCLNGADPSSSSSSSAANASSSSSGASVPSSSSSSSSGVTTTMVSSSSSSSGATPSDAGPTDPPADAGDAGISPCVDGGYIEQFTACNPLNQNQTGECPNALSPWCYLYADLNTGAGCAQQVYVSVCASGATPLSNAACTTSSDCPMGSVCLISAWQGTSHLCAVLTGVTP